MVRYKKIDIEFNRKEICPYCLKEEVLRVTCGDPKCQYKHHIASMRYKRKTKQVRPTARVKI